jgi:hypothetical protein
MAKRWWLMTANARMRANIRGDAWRGVIAWPLARLDSTPAGDVMARIIGDVEVLGVGLREFTIETWDTLLFSLSLMVAMLVFDPHLTVLALLPVPVAMLLAKATGRWVARSHHGLPPSERFPDHGAPGAAGRDPCAPTVWPHGSSCGTGGHAFGGASSRQPGPGAAARRTPAGLHHAHECWRPAGGLAGGERSSAAP